MKPSIPDTGTVISLEGEHAVVRMKHEGSCSRCGAAAALVLGMVGGYFLGTFAGFPQLDIIAGFFSLLVVSFFSLRRLKRLDSSSSIEIVSVLSDP